MNSIMHASIIANRDPVKTQTHVNGVAYVSQSCIQYSSIMAPATVITGGIAIRPLDTVFLGVLVKKPRNNIIRGYS